VLFCGPLAGVGGRSGSASLFLRAVRALILIRNGLEVCNLNHGSLHRPETHMPSFLEIINIVIILGVLAAMIAGVIWLVRKKSK
jgi:hypothetical protein